MLSALRQDPAIDRLLAHANKYCCNIQQHTFGYVFYIYFYFISFYKIEITFEQLIGQKNKNVLRTIWASNWPKIKNVEAQKKFRCSYKKKCMLEFLPGTSKPHFETEWDLRPHFFHHFLIVFYKFYSLFSKNEQIHLVFKEYSQVFRLFC